jgi:hypothetical protein
MAGIASAGMSGFSSFNLSGVSTVSTSGYGSASIGYNPQDVNSALSANNNNQRPLIVNINQEGIMSQEEAASTSVKAVKAELWKENIIAGKVDQQ